MDEALWSAFSLIAQCCPWYVQGGILLPIIRQITGTSHGRRWFTTTYKNPLSTLFETSRLWQQGHINWCAALRTVRRLGFYRDTIRELVTAADITVEPIKHHVERYLRRYFHYREEVTLAYTPLVWRLASAYGFSEEQKQDLFQIGVAGLIHACERYNNDGPATFSTFARQWIRQAILMHVQRAQPIIKVSHSVLEEESRIRRKEMKTGEVDTSERAERIRRMHEVKDVVLSNDVDAEAEEKEERAINLETLPAHIRKVLIFRHGLIDHALSGASEKELAAERDRQFAAYRDHYCKAEGQTDL